MIASGVLVRRIQCMIRGANTYETKSDRRQLGFMTSRVMFFALHGARAQLLHAHAYKRDVVQIHENSIYLGFVFFRNFLFKK